MNGISESNSMNLFEALRASYPNCLLEGFCHLAALPAVWEVPCCQDPRLCEPLLLEHTFHGPRVLPLRSDLHCIYYDKFNICNWSCLLNFIFHKWTLTSFYCLNISLWKFLLPLRMFYLWEFSTHRSFIFPIVNYICIYHFNSLYCCEGSNGLSQSRFG